jgi:hypothetical protein
VQPGEPGAFRAPALDLIRARTSISIVVSNTLAQADGAAKTQSVPASGSKLLSRFGWLLFFVPATAVLITAAFLTPNPIGHGTHTQLGLPPCGFYVMTGVPCPGCGLTTCFAYMVRADVIGAANANPFGIMLFLTTLAVVPVSLRGLVRGSPVIDTLDRMHADKWAILLAGCSLTVWIVRVVTILL